MSRRAALLGLAALATGCAQAPLSPGAPQWSGRLSLRVDGNPVRLWQAGFVVAGSERAGSITLLAPLGATLARATWSPEGAELVSSDERRAYADVDTMTEDLIGEPVPMPALFAWLTLAGSADVPGWRVDDSAAARGVLRASRTAQAGRPAVLLTVALDR